VMKNQSSWRYHHAIVAVAATLSLLGGCSRKPPAVEPAPCDKQVVTVGVIATPNINAEESGESRPVQLRLYQLKNDVAFRNATFEQVWKEDEAKLAGDVLVREEVSIYPGTRSTVEFERNPEAEYVVAAGLFRTPKGKQWFATFELPPPPGEEACGAKCPDGECAEPPELNPKIFVRLDGTRVEDGSSYADEFAAPSVAAVPTPSGGAF
jgi:type VI secretion system protein VasD